MSAAPGAAIEGRERERYGDASGSPLAARRPAERPGQDGRVTPVTTTEQVWGALHNRLRPFIRARVGGEESAEDILQDVFLRIHARIDTLKDEDRLESWVWQIVRNAIADHHRARRPTVDLVELSEELVAPDQADEDDAEDAARRLAPFVKAMVETLPEPYREALLLTEFAGLTQRELADRAGVSLSGAKSRVQRGREKLKQVLLDCCHVEFDRRGGIIDYQSRCDCCTSGCCATIDSPSDGPA